jgi:hypothetical protein
VAAAKSTRDAAWVNEPLNPLLPKIKKRQTPAGVYSPEIRQLSAVVKLPADVIF